MTMKRRFRIGLLASVMLIGATGSRASLIGPWFRYDCRDLGFEMLVATGWKMTRVPNGIVFAMQYQPEPYVRVAVGRIPLAQGTLQGLAGADARHSKSYQRTECKIDGLNAIRVEGEGPQGPYMDLYVQKGSYGYWIGFAADRPDLWTAYRKTFDIVLDGFHFI